MTCKRNGAVTVAWRILVRYSVRLQRRLNSDRKRRVLRFSWVSTYDGNKVALLLLESNYGACCLSLSPRRRKGGVRTGRRRWRADVSLKARRHQRWWDDNDQPQARWCFPNNNLSRLHLFCLLVNDPRSYNHVKGDDMRDSNPTFSCCLARVAIPCQVQQPGTAPPSGSKRSSFLSFFFHFWSKNSAETWNNRSPRSKEHFGAKKLEIYLRQKSRFWSVHACLKTLTMVSIETKVVSRDSFLDKLSEKTLLEWILRRITCFLTGAQCAPPPPPPGFWSTQKSLFGIVKLARDRFGSNRMCKFFVKT